MSNLSVINIVLPHEKEAPMLGYDERISYVLIKLTWENKDTSRLKTK